MSKVSKLRSHLIGEFYIVIFHVIIWVIICNHIFMNQKGFTLIELLVVIAIIGILAGFIIVSMSGASDAANDSRRKADINQLAKAVMIWKTNNPDTLFPVDTDGCNIGGDCIDIFGSASILRDPDGSYYTYASLDGNDFTITSRLSNNNDYLFESKTGKYYETSQLEVFSPTSLTFPVAIYNYISLSWVPGINSSKTLVVRKQGSIPSDRNDGVAIYSGTENSFTDTGLINGSEYCYALYATNDENDYVGTLTGCVTIPSSTFIYVPIGAEGYDSEGGLIISKDEEGFLEDLDGGQVVFLTPNNYDIAYSIDSFNLLIVAGGGGGGYSFPGGGGGAGGLVYKTNHDTSSSYQVSITVGDGGLQNTNGGNSSFGSIIALGGGAGSNSPAVNGSNGGSGGGVRQEASGGLGLQPSSTPGIGFGNNGGSSSQSSYRGSGGGGAGAVGANASGYNGAVGGAGKLIWGKYYSGGGGGGAEQGTGGSGGNGGGGRGGDGSRDVVNSDIYNGYNGTNYLGGGGGASGNHGNKAGKGGSGIVILRWGNYNYNYDPTL